ncbi:hypothetical protein XELAEV_18004300mg [Xenopus laevis]|uniref:Uncharacterized protein n=1 Tax=Xenopus laevis TaxID=8355 RepID=A0A974GYP8_XENLA|nr:hypothetical protein XELAEV_18004300mg [Xenopus laevis]
MVQRRPLRKAAVWFLLCPGSENLCMKESNTWQTPQRKKLCPYYDSTCSSVSRLTVMVYSDKNSQTCGHALTHLRGHCTLFLKGGY